MRKIILIFTGLSLIAGFAYAGDEGKVDIHGFISQGYLKTDHNNYMAETEDGSFQFNELGLNFGTDLTDKLRLGLQFFARDLGTDGNDKLVLDWVVADYRWRDFLGFRVGRIKLPAGYYYAIRDFDMLRTDVFVPQCVYPEILRDTFSFIKGISLYGNMIGPWGHLSYDYLTGRANLSLDTGLASAQEDFWSYYGLKLTDMTSSQSHSFDCKWETPLPGLILGGTAYYHKDFYLEGTLSGPVSDILKLTYLRTYMDFKGYFLMLRYILGDVAFTAELNQNRIESVIDADRSYDDPGYLKAEALTSQGWYMALSYRFNSFFEAEYMYSVFYPDKTNKHGKDRYSHTDLNDVFKSVGVLKQFYGNDFEAWKKTSTFSFRFDINEYWLFKLEAAYNDGFGEYTSADNRDHSDLKRYWWLYAAKVTYNF
ncbi:MAG: hypothetical protein KJ737_14830 [Proteobacteria bacterium]|nr:hypothetical protein [Pseudomonadota bacterium]